MSIYRIIQVSRPKGEPHTPLDDDFPSLEAACGALCSAMGWSSIVVAGPVQRDNDFVFSCYPTAAERDADEERDHVPLIRWIRAGRPGAVLDATVGEAVDTELTTAFREGADAMIEAIGRVCAYAIAQTQEADAAARAGTISQKERTRRVGELTESWAHLSELLAGCALTLEETASVARLLRQ